MRLNSVPKGMDIAGSDCLIIDNEKVTKRVDFKAAAEFIKGEIFGGGGDPHRKRTDGKLGQPASQK